MNLVGEFNQFSSLNDEVLFERSLESGNVIFQKATKSKVFDQQGFAEAKAYKKPGKREETIQILAEEAFAQDWFNETHSLNLSKMDLIDLLRAATKNQIFQFDGALNEQTDGVAMGYPLGPLLANVFMCSIDEPRTTRSTSAVLPKVRR